MPFKIHFFLDHCLIRCKLKLRYNLALHRLLIYWSLRGMRSKEEEAKGWEEEGVTKANRGWERQREADREHFRGDGSCILHAQWKASRAKSTFRGVFRASGNSLSSSRSQRCINCCTIGFSGLTIWNPEMLAPPAKTLSKLTLENPWVETRKERTHVTSLSLSLRFFVLIKPGGGGALQNSMQGAFYYELSALWKGNMCLPLHEAAVSLFPFTHCGVNLNALTGKQPAIR